MMKLALLATLLIWLNGTPVTAAPRGFEDRLVIGNLPDPLDFTWTPQGQMMVVQKKGQVLVLEDPNGDYSYSQQTLAFNFKDVICTVGERGVSSIRVHPNFNENRFVYIYFTFKKHGTCNESSTDGPVNRLARFVLTKDNKLDYNSQLVLFDTPPLANRYHNGGSIEFGKDGNIWIGLGESGIEHEASNPRSLLGAMIRVRDDGSIPDGNPYKDGGVPCRENGVPPDGSPSDAKCQELYAIGLRNPWRIAMDPNTEDDKVRFFANDVGAATWEEISEGGTDFAGAHYGFPAREGPCRYSERDNCNDQHEFKEPFHYYIHEGGTGNGGAATGGAFVPANIGWPADYDNAYLYSDYVFGKIYRLRDNGKGECRDCNPPYSRKEVSDFTEHEGVVTLRFGPYKGTQALYYSSILAGGVIRRVAYVAGDVNRLPTAVIDANPTTTQPGTVVKFNGGGSSDSDGDPLSYRWDLDGNGSVDSTSRKAEFTYDHAGVFEARLTVRDNKGGEDTSTVQIKVGNPPEPVITTPPEGTMFRVGELFILRGYATDQEDGKLDDKSLVWEVRQHHDTHYHPFLPETAGNDIPLNPAFKPEDFIAATNSYLEIRLTATDRNGLTGFTNRIVQPKKVLVNFETVPPGLALYLDLARVVGPTTATSWEAHKLKVEARGPQSMNGKNYVWKSWSNDHSTSEQMLLIPPASTNRMTIVAYFEEVSGSACMSGALLSSGESISNNQVIRKPGVSAYLHQQTDGNLVAKDTADNVIWATNYYRTGDTEEPYNSMLQGDGNLITTNGRGQIVWTSRSFGETTEYFLALDSGCQSVWIYRGGTAANPGVPIWPEGYNAIANAGSSSSCMPGSLLSVDATIPNNQVIQNVGVSAYTHQQPDGNLVVKDKATHEVIWASNYYRTGETEAPYSSILQSDGNLVTSNGSGQIVWTSRSYGVSSQYFLALDLGCKSVSIYRGGSVENDGNRVWTSGDPACPYPLLFSGDTVSDGQIVRRPWIDYVYVTQQDDGNLVVVREGSDQVIWASGYYIPDRRQSYFSMLQWDANLITRRGSSSDSLPGKSAVVWKSDRTREEANFFLALNCDGTTVSIYKTMTGGNAGEEVWTSA